MAMLAGPRRKQKVINLRAKNNAWSSDATKFGQRMLEKMGWSEGKGLGAKENGIVEHVVAKYKNDDRGLGFEDRNDQWTKHEDDFNSLLANLSSGDKDDDKLHSGVSLEVKSKKSKARVHYHKFTRGKDLTRYSEKDLANIFGKKSLKIKNKQEPEDKQEVSDDADATPTEKVFTEKGSMEDYFKSKMAAIKSRTTLNISNNNTSNNDDADYSFRGFSGTNDEKDDECHQGFGFQSFSFNNTENDDKTENEITTTENHEVSVESKKKSKKKKNKHQEPEPLNEKHEDDVENNLINEITVDEPQKTKKNKKKKHKKDYEDVVQEETMQESVEVDSKKTKKKKKVSEPTEEDISESYVPKKKKKRKNMESCE